MPAYKMPPSRIYGVRDGENELFLCTTLKTAYHWLMWRVPVELRNDLKGYTRVCQIFRQTGSYRIKSINGGMLRIFQAQVHKKYQPDALGAISLL